MSAAAILDLERAGFTREQVKALARLIEAQTATKADVAALELRLAEAKAELIKWMFGIASGQLLLLLGIIKLLVFVGQSAAGEQPNGGISGESGRNPALLTGERLFGILRELVLAEEQAAAALA